MSFKFEVYNIYSGVDYFSNVPMFRMWLSIKVQTIYKSLLTFTVELQFKVSWRKSFCILCVFCVVLAKNIP